jgi:TetR/AcrR family transcriptional repressor of nem operon
MGSGMLRVYAGGSMTKGEETRQTIIERAAPLFNRRGFHGCSMSDIMEATGLEKGGIYRHFSSKEEIAQAAFRYSVEASIKLRTAGFEDIGSPLEMLRAMIARFVHTPSAVAGGCPLMNTAIDADDGNETLRGMVREAFKVWRGRVAMVLEQAIAEGEIASDSDIAWLSNTVIMTLEGAVMLSRLERRKDPLLHAQRALDVILSSLASVRV